MRRVRLVLRRCCSPAAGERGWSAPGHGTCPGSPAWRRALVPLLAVAVVVISPAAAAAAPAVAVAEKLLDDWQLEDALVMAEQILAAHPDDAGALLLAAQVQHQRGEHASALALLDAAEEAGLTAAGLRPLVETSARFAAHFRTRETPHFEIHYLNKDEIVAFYAEEVLEAAYANIAGDLGALPAERGEKIAVEIYPDARALAGATGLTLQEIETSGTIAVCKFHRLMITSPLATINGYEWGDTLAHEFAHLVISKKSRNNIPIWLHEGIAKFYESRWSGAAGANLSPYGEKLLAAAVRKRKYITFAQMHPSMAKLPSQEDAALAFAEVFTVIEYLRKRHGPQSIPRVLALTAELGDLEPALKRVFGTGLEGIEKQWRRFVEKRPFRELPGARPTRVRLAASEEEAQAERPLEEIEDRAVHDHARLGELLRLRQHDAAAVVEYEKAYARGGQRYPEVVYRLADAYAAVKRPDDALGLLARLLEVSPDFSDARLVAGRLELQRGKLDEARRHFEAVNLHNPFNPETHMALAGIYEEQGDAAAAAREKRFLALASKPRPTRTYELPSPPAGQARVSIVAPGWGQVRLNGGEAFATPAWRMPVAAGTLSIEYKRGNGAIAVESLEVKASEDVSVLILR